jgi:hypothetical protein
MTRPLSIWKYYHNHQQKVAIILIIISLSVFLQYALLIYMATLLKFKQAFTFFKSNIYVYTQKSKQSQFKQLLSKHPAIAKVFPFWYKVTSIFNGKPMIFLFYSKDMNPALHSLQLTLIKGRLPAPDTYEVALHWRIAGLKGLKVGDHFGYPYSEGDYLVGDYKLVGLLDGDLMIGLSDLETYIHDYHLAKEGTAFLVIPQKGQLAKVLSFLAQCIQKDSKLVVVQRDAPVNIENFYLDAIDLDAVYLGITCIVTICVSSLFYIYFYRRRPEFCLLEALGYTRPKIISKVLLEMTGISLAGFVLGGAVCLVSGYALNSSIFMERGLPLELWGISYPLKLLFTPIVIILSSSLIAWRMLKKADPISTIEGEV